MKFTVGQNYNLVIFEGTRRLSSGYGKRRYKYNGKWVEDFHYGMDFAGQFFCLSPVSGKVIYAGTTTGSLGAYVLIHGDDGYYYWYGHIEKWLVSTGQRVIAGQRVAYSDSRGKSTGHHLHFTISKTSYYYSAVDPAPILIKLQKMQNTPEVSSNIYIVRNGGYYWNIWDEMYKSGIVTADWASYKGWFMKNNPYPRQGGFVKGDRVYFRKLTTEEANQPVPSDKTIETIKTQQQENTEHIKEIVNKLEETEKKQSEGIEKLNNLLNQKIKEHQDSIAMLEEEIKNNENKKLSTFGIDVTEVDESIKDFTDQVNVRKMSDEIMDEIRDKGAKGWFNQTRKSLTNYDWKYILFLFISGLSILTGVAGMEFQDSLGILGFIGSISVSGKLLLDRLLPIIRLMADKDQDGRITPSDSDYLGRFIKDDN